MGIPDIWWLGRHPEDDMDQRDKAESYEEALSAKDDDDYKYAKELMLEVEE